MNGARGYEKIDRKYQEQTGKNFSVYVLNGANENTFSTKESFTPNFDNAQRQPRPR